jgi:ABC-type transporter Mla subunit MlaD
LDDAQTPEPAPVAPVPTVAEKQAAVDAALAELKARAEAAETRAADAEKKLQDALASETSLTAWLDSHLANIKAILPQ